MFRCHGAEIMKQTIVLYIRMLTAKGQMPDVELYPKVHLNATLKATFLCIFWVVPNFENIFFGFFAL